MDESARITRMIEDAELNLISTTPGAVPPHLDDGGHLPFGGLIGDTRGPSAFGKRKMTRANAIGNPQALLLNYPPENTEASLRCWERNCAPPPPDTDPLQSSRSLPMPSGMNPVPTTSVPSLALPAASSAK